MIALARTLLDVLFASVWQGALLAGCVAASLACFGRNANATTRCAVLQLTLLAIAVLPVATIDRAQTAHAIRTSGEATATPLAVAAAPFLWLRRVTVPLDDGRAVACAVLWCFIAGALLVRIAIGAFKLRHVVRYAALVTERGGVRVIASRTATVPLALGFGRPAVVIPVEIVEAGGARFECVALHEIGHIRRGDSWANLAERVAHALLFFNPAVSIVLRAISAERENACDDWAAARAPSVDTYVRSLASIAVWNAGTDPLLACGMSFGRSTLARIERLQRVGRNGATTLSPTPFGGSALMLISIALLVGSLAPAIAFEAGPVVRDVVATASCSHGVRILNAAEPTVTAAREHRKLTTKVRVSIAAGGGVTDASIAHSSGDAAFDEAVEAAAKKSRFAPAMRDCRPVVGTYVFVAQIAP